VKKGGLTDKPVTFHTQIKSSGYGALKPWAPPKSKAAKGAAKVRRQGDRPGGVSP
jgi:hypothetical protein